MQNRDLSRLHYDLLDGREETNFRTCLRVLEDDSMDYVLLGGWAVYAHVSEVPSVDVDLCLKDSDRLHRSLSRYGIKVGMGEDVEVLLPSDKMEVWGVQVPGLGLPEPSCTFEDLLENRTMTKAIELGNQSYRAIVPLPEALCISKLVALHNRSLAYRSFSEGEAGMLLGPELNTQLKGLSEDYWLRKAGKDAYDVGMLAGMHNLRLDALAELLIDVGLQDAMPTLGSQVPGVVMKMAGDLARRVGRQDPEAIIAGVRTRLAEYT